MTANKQENDKRDLIILDFDGTIIHNPTNNFGVYMPLEDVLDANSFFSEFMYQTRTIISKKTELILITGRHSDQKEIVSHVLKLKGYKITNAYFNQMERKTVIDESSFLIKYWTAKVELINQLRMSNEYKSVIALDNDPIITSMLEKINIPTFLVEMSKNLHNQTLSITFNPPQIRTMTDLQTILTPPQTQREQTTKSVKIFT